MNFSRGGRGPLFCYCDLELDPITFISELDIDMVAYSSTTVLKKKVSITSASKVTTRMDARTDRNTDMMKTLPLRICGR